MSRHGSARVLVVGLLLVAAGAWWLIGSRERGPELEPPVEASAADGETPLSKDERTVTEEVRAELLARAHVWQAPDVPVPKARFTDTTYDELSCKFKIDDMGGTTPKFDCHLESGEEVRVKYGNGPEIPAEAAATWLLKALGFGADDVILVRKLRCYGCPLEPFSTMKAAEMTRTEALLEGIVDYNHYQEFDWVAVERKFDARPIETQKIRGWSFFELDAIDENRGAPRAHVDALRLMAVLLAHWDNKAENQRMVCLGTWPEGTACPRPFLLLHDVGASFGPTKMDLDGWAAAPVWADRTACTVSMRDLPFGGATFASATITEEGRRFAGGLLSQLSESQVTELFTAARFGERRGPFAPVKPVAEWVRVFEQKVRAISEGGPCPPR